MKIQYASDLHIEFPENKDFLKVNPIKPLGDTLVLAGDIVPFAVLDKYHDFFNYLADNFENIYWIPGNHEYYYSDFNYRSGSFHEKIKENVHLLNNCIIEIDNTGLFFTTLWSRISPTNQWHIYNRMNDFRLIKHHSDYFSIELYNQLHSDCLQFLQKSLVGSKAEKKVIVSHHVPTFMNYPEAYRGDPLNEAFAVELFGFIEQNQPDLWIYGHTHANVNDFNIGKTSLVTNQLGYLSSNEHSLFNNCKTIKL